jgi:hypothetical protein
MAGEKASDSALFRGIFSRPATGGGARRVGHPFASFDGVMAA